MSNIEGKGNKQSPDCLKCAYVRSIPGDAHKSCAMKEAKVKANVIGVNHGWFIFPSNFDPRWLIECDSFKKSILLDVMD